MSTHQQAAIRRLEELFRDVKLEQLHNNPELIKHEIKIDKCCEVHGKHAKENCWNRRGSLGNVPHTVRKDSFGRYDYYNYSATSPTRRGSLGMPLSPPKRELHPSTFPSTLRKSPLGSSMSAINNTRKDLFSNTIGGSSLRREPIGRSMGCLRKDTTSNYNSPLRRDYVAKSMTNLQRSAATQRRDGAPNLASLFAAANSPTNLSSSNVDFKARSYSNGNLKSCLAGSSGNLRGNLNVTLSGDRASSTSPISSSLRKTDGKSATSLSSGRRGSYDRRRLSTDSLDNLKRNSWDPGRRGSSGSSGGWDDPIWEEGSSGADQVITSSLYPSGVREGERDILVKGRR